jgi:hypothetical protein
MLKEKKFRKLKNSRCKEISCYDCPLNETKIPCSPIAEDSLLTFGVHYKQLKEIVKLLEKDLEKEVEVDE